MSQRHSITGDDELLTRSMKCVLSWETRMAENKQWWFVTNAGNIADMRVIRLCVDRETYHTHVGNIASNGGS